MCGIPIGRASPSMLVVATPPPDTDPEASAGHWEVLVGADREYYERMEPDGIDFPADHVDRTFRLSGLTAAIGRRAGSKGIEPEIDLSAAPEDIGVSHQHAVLMIQGDGTWSLVDPGSTNGTYLNEDVEPLPRHQAVALHDGDRVHVGAWTTITLRQVSTEQ